MDVVVSHLNFEVFAGTESYTLTIVRELERAGHRPTIFAHRLGEMSDFARGLGLRVVSTVEDLPAECQLVIAQDGTTAIELAERYPEAARLFVMHSGYPMQAPPRLADCVHAIVVMNERRLRGARELVPHLETVRLRQPVDLERFTGRRKQDRRPRWALLLSNQVDGAQARMIESACRLAGFELSRTGLRAGSPTAAPEHAIAGADVVITIGRGVVEGMSAGRAVYVSGAVGTDGWVTPENYPSLEQDGFSGRAFDASIDQARMAADLSAYDERMGVINRDLAWAHHDVGDHVRGLLELGRRHGPAEERREVVNHAEELARLIRLEWYEHGRVDYAVDQLERMRMELDDLRERGSRLEAERSQLKSLLAAADGRFDALTATRRYRLAAGLARPLDRLRGRR